MNEGTLTRKMKQYLQSQGAYVENIWGGGFQASGIPDLIACYKGVFLGLEVKLDYNKPSEIQKVKIKMINDAGGIGRVVYSIDEVKQVLREVDERVDKQ